VRDDRQQPAERAVNPARLGLQVGLVGGVKRTVRRARRAAASSVAAAPSGFATDPQGAVMFHPSTFAAHGDHYARRVTRRHTRGDAGAAVLIRPASPDDEPAVARLSALDEHVLPRGERLIGELGGRIVAALDVRSGDAVADPFVPTAGSRRAVGLRAAQVRR